MQRGTLIHKLLERLPALGADQRASAANQWLTHNAANLSGDDREEIIASVLQVIGNPAFADVFHPDALCEVPITALVGRRVVTGIIDRLRIEERRILLIDFKTTLRPPHDAGAIAPGLIRQMAAYVAALEKTYPNHTIEAALLYTHAPALIVLDKAILTEQIELLLQDEA